MESDPSTEEVVQLLNERIECVGSGDMVGRLVDEGLIPLTCRAIHKATRKQNLVVRIDVGIHIGSDILNEA